MSERRTVAVVGGAGFWGIRYLRGFSEHPGCDLISIADTAVERRSVCAEHFGIPHQCDTVDELLSYQRPDIVSAVLPVSISYDVVMKCLDASVPVVTCEKPISESLEKADRLVDTARSTNTPLFCGTARWEIPHITEVAEWLKAGHFGELVRTSIPTGFNDQVSGNGCVILCFLRYLTCQEIAWVEGYTDPPDAAFSNEDCNAYGMMGLTGGATCSIGRMDLDNTTGRCVYADFENGRVWLTGHGPILIEGSGDLSRPVYPDFLKNDIDSRQNQIDSYLDAFESRGEAFCSAHDYREVLEIAIALKLSARDGHRRIQLPLEDRSQVLYPHPYRMLGGDVVGWDSIGLPPPRLPGNA